jgi:hypothetical protein
LLSFFFEMAVHPRLILGNSEFAVCLPLLHFLLQYRLHDNERNRIRLATRATAAVAGAAL